MRRDDAEAARWLTRAVEQDDRTAKLNLANLYFEGRGVPKDPLRGLALLQQAAEAGLPQALNDLAVMEMKRPRASGARAVRMLRQAAVSGAAVAYHNLGMALVQGWDGTPDYEEANYWFRKSIDNRSDIDPEAHSESQFQLGRNLVTGLGTTRDMDEGMRLIIAAAEVRNARALDYLKTAGRGQAKAGPHKASPGKARARSKPARSKPATSAQRARRR